MTDRRRVNVAQELEAIERKHWELELGKRVAQRGDPPNDERIAALEDQQAELDASYAALQGRRDQA